MGIHAEIIVLRDMTLFTVVEVYRRFGGTGCLDIQISLKTLLSFTLFRLLFHFYSFLLSLLFNDTVSTEASNDDKAINEHEAVD
jgi:hypothetical protein